MRLFAEPDERISVFRAAELLKEKFGDAGWFESISVVDDFSLLGHPTIIVFASDPDAPDARRLCERKYYGFLVHVMRREDFRKNTYSDFKGMYIDGAQIVCSGTPATDDGAYTCSVPVVSEDGKMGYMMAYVRDGILRVEGREDERVFYPSPEWRLA